MGRRSRQPRQAGLRRTEGVRGPARRRQRQVVRHRKREAREVIKRAADVLGALERALTVIAVVFLFVIMVLVVTDVFMRYALNRPFSFTYDLIGLYLLAGVFFFTVSDALREHAHVGVDILLSRFSPAGRSEERRVGKDCRVGGVL